MLQKHNLFHLFIWIYRNCKLVNVLGKTKVQLSEIHVLKGEKILQRPDTGLRDTSGPSVDPAVHEASAEMVTV